MCKSKQIADDDARYADLDSYLDSLQGQKGIAMIALQKAQELFGFLPLEVHKHVSAKTGLSVAELYGVSSFYSQFLLEPEGRHRISVCMGTACYVKGAGSVLDRLKELLGIEVGQVTEDGLFSLSAARCLGCCGLAPVIMIDKDVYANLVDLDELEGILANYGEADPVSVSAGLAGEAEALS